MSRTLSDFIGFLLRYFGFQKIETGYSNIFMVKVGGRERECLLIFNFIRFIKIKLYFIINKKNTAQLYGIDYHAIISYAY